MHDLPGIKIWLLHNLVEASFDLFRYLILGDQLKAWDLHPVVALCIYCMHSSSGHRMKSGHFNQPCSKLKCDMQQPHWTRPTPLYMYGTNRNVCTYLPASFKKYAYHVCQQHEPACLHDLSSVQHCTITSTSVLKLCQQQTRCPKNQL